MGKVLMGKYGQAFAAIEELPTEIPSQTHSIIPIQVGIPVLVDKINELVKEINWLKQNQG